MGRSGANCLRRAGFWILPIALRGTSSTISSCSGTFCLASPSSRQCSATSTSESDVTPSANTTTAHARSPVRGSGRPITATSAMPGCWWRISSTSPAEMFSGVADDDVLQAPGDRHVAGVGDDAEIAGAEEALLVERVGVELGVGVAQEEVRPPEPELALLARTALAAVEADDPELDARRRPPLGGRRSAPACRRRSHSSRSGTRSIPSC